MAREPAPLPPLVANACPVPAPYAVTLPASGAAPVYDRAMWLADSLTSADAVVRGKPDPERGTFFVESVVCGDVAGCLVEGRTLRVASARFSQASGLWMLMRTPQGCWSTNPDVAPLPEQEWSALVASAGPRDAVPVDEVASNRRFTGSLYRLTRREPKALHGAAVQYDPTRMLFQWWDQGELVFVREFGEASLVYVMTHPRKGTGFVWDQRRGAPHEAYFTVDARKRGVYRRYFANGKVAYEIAFDDDGFRHGPERTYLESGALQRENTWEHGLRWPLARCQCPGPSLLQGVWREYGIVWRAAAGVVDRIKVGMSAVQVARIIQGDFSPSLGLRFLPAHCDGYHLEVRFADDKVADIEEVRNGSDCD